MICTTERTRFIRKAVNIWVLVRIFSGFQVHNISSGFIHNHLKLSSILIIIIIIYNVVSRLFSGSTRPKFINPSRCKGGRYHKVPPKSYLWSCPTLQSLTYFTVPPRSTLSVTPFAISKRTTINHSRNNPIDRPTGLAYTRPPVLLTHQFYSSSCFTHPLLYSPSRSKPNSQFASTDLPINRQIEEKPVLLYHSDTTLGVHR